MTYQDYLDQKVNRRTSRVEGKIATNVFYDGATIFSYGRHFPMAYIIDEKYILVNADKYSINTSKHQSCLRYIVHGSNYKALFVSFSAMRSANIGTLESDDIIDYSEGISEEIIKVGAKYYTANGEVWKQPYVAGSISKSYYSSPQAKEFANKAVKEHPELKEDEIYVCNYHLAGGLLFKYKHTGWLNNRFAEWTSYYLSAVDEGSYFLSELPQRHSLNTIGGAFDALVPRTAKVSENGYLRQGEWFFVPSQYDEERTATSYGYKNAKQMERLGKKLFVLPRTDERSNRHEVYIYVPKEYIDNNRDLSDLIEVAPNTGDVRWKEFNRDLSDLIEVEPNTGDVRWKKFGLVSNRVLAAGRCIHRNAFNEKPSGEHKTIKFSGHQLVSRNTELASYGSMGKVD